MIYRFAGYSLDPEHFELTLDGDPVVLQPRALHLLIMLVKAEGRIVTKDRIYATIWEGRAISENALASQIKGLRKALGGTALGIIETVHGLGFRILPQIERIGPAVPAPEQDVRDPIGKPPSIAVLPFAAIGADDSSPVAALGIPAEIIDALARLHWLKVIARTSTFQLDPAAGSLDTVRRVLGVDYCLSGLLELREASVVIAIELADTRDQSIVWTERYECAAGSILDIREEIVRALVPTLEVLIAAHEMQRTKTRDPSTLSAWEAYHTGVAQMLSPVGFNWRKVQSAFDRALSMDPDFARAHAAISELCWRQVKEQADMRPERLQLLVASAERAVEIDLSDPLANLVRGRVSYFQQDWDQTSHWFHRAIDQCPNFALAHHSYGSLLLFQDKGGPAVHHLMKAIDLSPTDPDLYRIYALLAAAECVEGDFAAAADWSARAMELPHKSTLVTQVALCCMHHAGRTDEARMLAGRIRHLSSKSSIRQAMQVIPTSQKIQRLVVDAMGVYGLG